MSYTHCHDERHGSTSDRDELIESFLPLARRLATRYAGSAGSEPMEDLIQVACVGLINAADRFDSSRGTSFSSFAVPTILGELRRHFRDRGWSIRPPRDVQELVLKVRTAQAELPTRLGHAPTVLELADSLGTSQEKVLEALHASQSHYAKSFDEPESGDDTSSWHDRVGETDDNYELVESTTAIQPQLRTLSDRNREVLRLRFVEDLTQSEIAARVGVSQMQISRILRQTLDQLRAAAEEELSIGDRVPIAA